MIFDDMKFHNTEAMVPQPDGWLLSRLPRETANCLDGDIRDRTSFYGSGVELRFRLKSDEVKLHFRARKTEEAQTAAIYFGSFQGGWQYSVKPIGEQDSVIELRYPEPEKMKKLEEITKEKGLPFEPQLVRVLFPYGTILYIGKEGETEPPHVGDEPGGCYLAYGSSITHGSLGLTTPYTYAFQIAQTLGVDYINQGYAGTAFMERPMAEYLTARKDWTFASVEMGINMIGKPISNEAYEERIREFLRILALDTRPVFVTDIFRHEEIREHDRTALFREIVKKYANGKNMIYVPGTELFDNPAEISADLTHPAGMGQLEIARNWSAVMRRHLADR